MKRFFTLLVAILSIGFSFGQTFNESQGTGSGVSITTGDYNTLYGDSSGTSLSSGSLNTMVGYQAGSRQTSASDNIFVGAGAGGGTTTGVDNVVIGTRAGGWGATSPSASGTAPVGAVGTDNTIIGVEAGMVIQVGASDNTIIGEEAGQALVDGDDNVFIGEDAGFNTTTASDNTFIGSASGRQNTTGYRNTFVGNESGYDNTTGFWNTCIGDSAGVDNSTGWGNTMVGHASGAATEYGIHNTFIGNNAGWDNNRTNTLSEGSYNTYLGSDAGFSNREGNGNVAIGYAADFVNTAMSGSNNQDNIAIGRQALIGSQSNGVNGIITIGPYSRVDRHYSIGMGYGTSVAGARTISIGYEADITANDDDNTVVGYQPSISGDRTSVFGSGSSSLDNDATVFGYAASADSMSTAFGSTASALGQFSTAIGYGASTSQNNAMVLGGASATDRVSVGIGTSTPNTSASLTLADTDKGFLMNRMTTAQRTTFGGTLGAPEQGMAVYDTDINALYTWDGTAWNTVTNTDAQDLSLSGNTLSLTNDASTVDLSGYLDNTDAQTVSLVGTTLSISNGNSVDLSAIDTDTQLNEAQVDAYVANNGYLTSFTEVDGDVTNEIQDISLTGTNLSISSGSTIDLSSIDTDTDTDDQTLSLTGTTLTIADGNSVDLASIDTDTDTDDQTLSLTGTTLTIADGNSVDLASIDTDTDTQLTEAEVDAFVANNGYLTTFTEVDGDVTNEIQDISLVGTDLSISSGSTIDLSGIDTDTDDQTLSLAGTTLTIADGNSVDLSSIDTDTDTQLTEAEVDAYVANNGYLTSFTEVDGDVTNEIQDISLVGSALSISSGSTIDLSGVDTDDQTLSLIGTTLSIADGNSVDLAAVSSNTDEQDLTAATLTGTVLQIEIENGSSVSVDLSPLLTDLQTQITNLDDRVTYLEGCACQNNLDENGELDEQPILYQNIPNPFNNTSSIKYYIPSYAESANLVISNEMGQLISNIELYEVGEYGEAYINAAGLSPGAYYYTLYVNQTKFETKTMVIE